MPKVSNFDMKCIKCSAEIPENSNFCNVCGAKQVISARGTKKRGNGQGSAYKLPSGSWAAQITLGYYLQDGVKKPKYKRKKGFKTKKEAISYLESLRNGFEERKVITLSELWELFQSELSTLSKSKQTAYRIAWKKIHSEVEYRTIDSFSVPELQELIDETAPSYYTRRDIKTLLSHMYKIAIRDDYTDKNRTEYIKLPKLVTSERQIFSPEDKAKLWKDFQNAPSGIIAGILTMLYTGIRPGELLTIRTENVHLREQYMTGGIKTKKGQNRKIILPDKLLQVMQYLIDNSKRERLLYYCDDEDFYSDWRAKRSELGINEALTPYCCRHTYITNLTALKVSPAMLQELAGHEDYDTTLEYTHLSVQDRLTEVNRLI